MAVNKAFYELHLVTKFNSIYQQTVKAKNAQQEDKLKEFSTEQSNSQPDKGKNTCISHSKKTIDDFTDEKSVNNRNKAHTLQNKICKRKVTLSYDDVKEKLHSPEMADDANGHRSLSKTKASLPSERVCPSRMKKGEIDIIHSESSSDLEDIHSSPVRNLFEKCSGSLELAQSRSRSSQQQKESFLLERNTSRKKRSPQKRRLSKQKVKTPTSDKVVGMKDSAKRKRLRQTNSKSSRSTETKGNNQKELDHVLLTELNPKSKNNTAKLPRYEHDLMKRNIMPLSEALKKGDEPFLLNVQSLFGKAGVLNKTNRTWQTIVDER